MTKLSPVSKLPYVSLVVPTYRRPEPLRATLSRVRALDYPATRFEVLVVDDADESDTPAIVHAILSDGPRIQCLSQQQRGVASARNLGAKKAHGDLIIFLDDDILIEPDHISRHLAVRDRHGDCLVNGHWEFTPELKRELEQTAFGRFRLSLEDWVKGGISKMPLEDGRLRPAGVTACNLSISTTRFRALGGFDETFPFAGCEDQDFSHRAAQAGCMFVYDPGIRLLHNDHRSTLEQFGARQRRGARTFVHLAARHPEAFADRPLLLENAPISRHDHPRLQLKKVAKRAFSLPPGLSFMRWMCRELEKHRPQTPLLRHLYEANLGAEIFLGVRDGLTELPRAREAAAAAVRRQRMLGQSGNNRATLHPDAPGS